MILGKRAVRKLQQLGFEEYYLFDLYKLTVTLATSRVFVSSFSFHQYLFKGAVRVNRNSLFGFSVIVVVE